MSTISSDYDLLVVGGGINGAGIARDAAGRGVKTLLCEQADLAQYTSSASTKLIHGGLRYLEHYDFLLVRHALQEREILLRAAPHIIWPMRFVLPHHKELRPRWLIRLGLFLYDHIGGRKLLPASHSLDLAKHTTGKVLQTQYKSGFEYSDCWVQDARLVVLNVMDAAARGCDVRVRVQVTDLIRHDGQWEIKLLDHTTGERSTVTAKAVVNASGPWVEKTLDLDEEHDARHGVRLVKGSHIVVPRLFDHEYAYIFQNADNRIVFAIPYEKNYTLLGTTDVEVGDEPGEERIEEKEIDYICKNVSEYFDVPLTADQVIWTYSGVRPLYDDASENASKVTRDYKLDLDTRKNAPVLSVYGGKITTYRKLSEQAIDMLKEHLDISAPDWTADAALPGGDIDRADFTGFLSSTLARFEWLNEELAYDYARNYGTRIDQLLAGAQSMSDLGTHFGGLLYQAEVDYLAEHEWARTTDDILWRRSKKGLQLNDEQVRALSDYLSNQFGFKQED